jgi:hypothetical protein
VSYWDIFSPIDVLPVVSVGPRNTAYRACITVTANRLKNGIAAKKGK